MLAVSHLCSGGGNDPAFFHILVHVITRMINSGSLTLSTTPKVLVYGRGRQLQATRASVLQVIDVSLIHTADLNG